MTSQLQRRLKRLDHSNCPLTISSQPCGPGELYCLKCRMPKRPALGMVDYQLRNELSGCLKALCETCEQPINRNARLADLPAIMPEIAIQFTGRQSSISGRAELPSNCDLKRDWETMAKHNAANERIKREYFQYLKEAKGRDEKSLDVVAKALRRFESSTRFRDYKLFHKEQTVAFKRQLAEQKNEQTSKLLSKVTIGTTMRALHSFFEWLAGQPGYKSKLNYSDADYFSISEKDLRIGRAKREQPVPSMEQMHHVIDNMPTANDIEKRNRAMVALILLTGVRDGALVSLKLKHISIAERRLDQDAREVKTKFAKTFSTWFFPVGGITLEIITEWVRHLREDLLFGDDDPLFPKTKMKIGNRGYEANGLDRECWSTAGPVRKIFKQAFEAAGLTYFKPHSVRKTLARFGQQIC